MALLDILLLAVLLVVCWFFWQLRKMAELAKLKSSERCEELNLQLLNIARTEVAPARDPQGHLCLKAVYQFEFSSNGEDSYLGTLVLTGEQVMKIDFPPYRVS